MSEHAAVFAITTMTRPQQEHGCQRQPAAHGMHHNRPGEIMEAETKLRLDPFLNTKTAVPGDTFKGWVDQRHDHEGRDQLRIKPCPFGNTARNDGRDRRRKGKQEEKFHQLVAIALG